MRTDFTINNQGSIVLFHPRTEAARAWWAENCGDGMTWGAAFVVEHRYADDIISGISEAGLSADGAR